MSAHQTQINHDRRHQMNKVDITGIKDLYFELLLEMSALTVCNVSCSGILEDGATVVIYSVRGYFSYQLATIPPLMTG